METSKNALAKVEVLTESDNNQFEQCLTMVRDDLRDNPYILETLRVLPVGGYRSAIGSFWNAVIDDLRQKVIYRSLELFNKEINIGRKIMSYEDFQNYVNDDQLIEGAYKMGIIGWEANKVLKHAKETRHIFDGHPKSSDPTPLKTLSMMEDCVKYVLSQEFSPQIIDISDYITLMGTSSFDRNEISISNALNDLPEIYRTGLINRLFTAYINLSCPSLLRSNIETVVPILWKSLTKATIIQVCRRIDTEIINGNKDAIQYAFSFIQLVDARKYLTSYSRTYHLGPIIKKLEDNLDQFSIENDCIDELKKFAGYIPKELLYSYVNAITQTYVGRVGGSFQFSRTDFYADRAAINIPDMFEVFDNESVEYFIDVIKNNIILKSRILGSNVKLRRLRFLGKILIDRVSSSFESLDILNQLVDETREKEFIKTVQSTK